jgi:hypothetical protein
MVGGTAQFNPQPPQNQNQNNTAPANVFAQMKAGTFAQNNDSEPQQANRYDAFRPNREFPVPRRRCWKTRSDTLTCSFSCPAHWMAPRPRCLWVVLISTHDLRERHFSFVHAFFPSGIDY